MTTNTRIPVRIMAVRITAAGVNTEGFAAVDECDDVHFVVPGDDDYARSALLDMVDGPGMYEVVNP